MEPGKKDQTRLERQADMTSPDQDAHTGTTMRAALAWLRAANV